MDNGHSSCKPTKAKPSRNRCFATGTSACEETFGNSPAFRCEFHMFCFTWPLEKKTSWTVRKHKSDTTTINTYHIQDLKNQKSQYFPVNIKIQCTHINFKTSFVKYTSNISPCTPPCARGPKCFRPTTSGFFSVEHFASVTFFLPTTCLVSQFPILQLKHHWCFVGTWDPRNAMQGSAGFCFSKKKIGGKQ